MVGLAIQEMKRSGAQRPKSIAARLVWRSLMAACLLLGLQSALAAEPLRVAAASDLRSVWLALAGAFEQGSGIALSPSFAASGKLSQQIEHGAPFDVFLSADQAIAQRLVDRGLTRGAAQRYTRGRLGLWLRQGSPVQGLEQLASRLQGRLVIANPRHAPYGARAEQALRASAQWSAVESHLVIGENVAQAAQLALSGQAEAALIAWSLRGELSQGRWLLIDEQLHEPLWQVAVVLKTARSAESDQLLLFLQSERAQAIFVAQGFMSLSSAP